MCSVPYLSLSSGRQQKIINDHHPGGQQNQNLQQFTCRPSTVRCKFEYIMVALTTECVAPPNTNNSTCVWHYIHPKHRGLPRGGVLFRVISARVCCRREIRNKSVLPAALSCRDQVPRHHPSFLFSSPHNGTNDSSASQTRGHSKQKARTIHPPIITPLTSLSSPRGYLFFFFPRRRRQCVCLSKKNAVNLGSKLN